MQSCAGLRRAASGAWGLCKCQHVTNKREDILKFRMVHALAALSLTACVETLPHPTPSPGILPAPTTSYACERGTQLAVKLLGSTAEVGVNGAAPVSLPSLGTDGTTYTNGRQTITIVQGRLSFAMGRMAAEACTPR